MLIFSLERDSTGKNKGKLNLTLLKDVVTISKPRRLQDLEIPLFQHIHSQRPPTWPHTQAARDGAMSPGRSFSHGWHIHPHTPWLLPLLPMGYAAHSFSSTHCLCFLVPIKIHSVSLQLGGIVARMGASSSS